MPAKSKKSKSRASKVATKSTASKKSARTSASSTQRSAVRVVSKTAPKTFNKSQSKNWWQAYLAQREQFYQDNPNSKWLIGMLIVVSLVHFALLYREYWIFLY